jgi:Cu(I)/Ag(I) efflux system membrane fusion protein
MFRPDMFVSAVIKTPLPRGVVLPVTAIMDTGKRQVVWVEVQPGVFEPRDVQAGERIGDKVQIISGIKPGEKVAVSGAYLIDSESQLRGGGPQDHSQHTGGAKPDGKGPATPPKKDSLKMNDMKM